MNTKVKRPRGTRSLATTLAIAFFTLSVIVLLVNGGFPLYTNPVKLSFVKWEVL